MQLVRAGDGTGIAYEVTGSGPAVVLLHGLTEDHRLWAPIVDRLRGDFTCVAVDARGHGESDASKSGYDPFTMAADVATVIATVGAGEPPFLVGHSMGGLLATLYAAGALGPVRGVVNVDQTLRLTDFAAVVRPLRPELEGSGFDAVITTIFDALGVDALPPEAAARVRAYDRGSKRDVVLGMWAPLFEMTDQELTALVEHELLPNIRVPYLAIHGPDPGPDYVEWVTTRVPTSEVEVWGGSHWLHLGDPDRFVNRVRDFVAAT